MHPLNVLFNRMRGLSRYFTATSSKPSKQQKAKTELDAAFLAAFAKGQWGKAEQCLDAGADIDTAGDGFIPALAVALAGYQKDIDWDPGIKLALSRHASFDFTIAHYGTVAHMAAESPHGLQVIDAMIAAKARIEGTNFNGETPLGVICAMRLDTQQELKDALAKIDRLHKAGCSLDGSPEGTELHEDYKHPPLLSAIDSIVDIRKLVKERTGSLFGPIPTAFAAPLDFKMQLIEHLMDKGATITEKIQARATSDLHSNGLARFNSKANMLAQSHTAPNSRASAERDAGKIYLRYKAST